MNRAQAFHAFWSSFGMTAIDEQSAYDETMELPDKYISYEFGMGEIGDKIALTASIWHRSTSWEFITQKAEEIYRYIGNGGVKVNFDGGQLWITRGSRFYKRGPIEVDPDVRRIIININAESLSA